ncbi:37s ribosomal protein rsm22 [Diplodia corticola]|uniref:37s ribosomal protein rsm22 n=1 Tax=Diplodia corticola TaxID=236234 RepID=A0A1J9S312_9PEZI|nr:37s ribosomal protein rsm22 [Diplodia corticola]OJD34021.1 37s ribosomal protein rsm22 [Diplodia corticola]
MLLAAARPLQSICTACRSKLRASAAAATWSASSRASVHKRVRLSAPPSTPSCLRHQSRHFSASNRHRDEQSPSTTNDDPSNDDAAADSAPNEQNQARAVEGRDVGADSSEQQQQQQEQQQEQQEEGEGEGEETHDAKPPPPPPTYAQLEAAARAARQAFGEALPEALLSPDEFVVYERLYGAPLRIAPEAELRAEAAAEAERLQRGGQPDEGERMPDTLWVEGKSGRLVEVEYYYGAPERGGRGVEGQRQRQQGEGEEEVAVVDDLEVLAERVEALEVGVEGEEGEGEAEEWEYGGVTANEIRTHPLTLAGRFATTPSTLRLPKKEFVDPVAEILANANNKHLGDAASRVFGGPRLPHSTATPRPMGGESVQKPIPLEPSQLSMSPMEGDSYLAAVMPGTYAAVTSVLVEVRKRLGTDWIEGLLKKENGPLILDVSSGGAGVVAFREILKAEWERMQEASDSPKSTPAPTGKASVITGSDTMRRRAARFLENTTFLPRLPDTILPGEKVGPKARKVYDIVIAPHSLWSMKEDYMRKAAIQKYWSLLDPRGGILVLIEKGLPRGFEVIAGARALLLDNHIASPGATHVEPQPLDHLDPSNKTRVSRKEEGMIVAPCTNHAGCPMYTIPGISRNRKDFCYFKQRFTRPPYLQKLLGARDRNYEDVQFSYLAVRRGGDMRKGPEGVLQGEEATLRAFEGLGDRHRNPLQELDDVDDGAEPEAAGAEATSESFDPATAAPEEQVRMAEEEEDYGEATQLTLSLPRMIMPPLKRRGHVILDVCTPQARLERWTVPRSFGRQAYRDARKSQWGDLWALGAATRVPRTMRLGRKDESPVATGKIMASVVRDEEKTKLSKRDKEKLKHERGKSWKKGKETRKMERQRREVEREASDEDL